MHYITGALVAIVLLAIAAFSIQNLEAVEVSFLVWSISLSKVILILGMYILGMLTGWGMVGLVKKYFAKKSEPAKA